tara:strand:- start:598 stop:870 length:273 start_codon:yes stop_codon:yes gene_type:complete
MASKIKREKQRNQVKSRFYYIFWGAATVSVFAGQLYVGTGYRALARGLKAITDGYIVIPLKRDTGERPKAWRPYPDDGLWHPTDPPQRIW